MATVTLSAGEIDVLDSGGDGPALVLLHGVNMDATLWDEVVKDLGPRYRCIRPTLPLGSHRRAMQRGELVTHRGVAGMVSELLDALDLRDVILVMNDWGGAQYLLSIDRSDRIGAAALVACEAFDNFPPGRPGKAIAASARFRALLWIAMQLQRFGWFRRMPGGWGWMSKRPIPDDVMDRWFEPSRRDAAVRRDLRTFALSTPDRAELRRLSDSIGGFDLPALVVWATEDRMMPREHGPALASAIPHGRLIEIDDAYTLIPRDQPAALASALAELAERVGH